MAHQRTPESSPPPTSSAQNTTTTTSNTSPQSKWPLPTQTPTSAGSATSTRIDSRYSTSSAANRPVSGPPSSGLRGLFGRRSRSQQYQESPIRPVDPQAPCLPKVYLSPPASPELLAQVTTPEKVRAGQQSTMNGNSAIHKNDGHSTKSGTGTGVVHSNRHSVQSTAASLSPRMRRRRRDPTPFNILVIGFLGSGKTSFIRFLKESLGDSKRIRNVAQLSNEDAVVENVEDDLTQAPQKTNGFERHYLEKEVDGERVGITIFDSEGFGPREQNIVDIQLTLLINFITGKFEETFAEVSPRSK